VVLIPYSLYTSVSKYINTTMDNNIFLFIFFAFVISCNETNEKNQISKYNSFDIDTLQLIPINDDRPENFAPDTGTMTKDGLVYFSYDESPKFGKTDSSLYNYLKSNINYPDKAIFENIKGTVYVSFVVLKNGNISQIKILKGVNTYIDKECLRVFKDIPKWIPGYKNGETVNIQLNIPITF